MHFYHWFYIYVKVKNHLEKKLPGFLKKKNLKQGQHVEKYC